jgi:hypothetical protein
MPPHFPNMHCSAIAICASVMPIEVASTFARAGPTYFTYILMNWQFTAMAKDAKPLEALNANAKQTMATAYWAMDYYFDNLRKIVSSAPSGGTDFGEKLKGYAEENVRAMHDFIKQLTQAKDFEAVLRIQEDFVRSQFEAFDEQAKNLGETYAKSQFGTRDKSSS